MQPASSPIPQDSDRAERHAAIVRRLLADEPHNDAPMRLYSPFWRGGALETPELPPERDVCPACRGYGAQARVDGYRFDSAGPHFPCPSCGAKASDHWGDKR